MSSNNNNESITARSDSDTFAPRGRYFPRFSNTDKHVYIIYVHKYINTE